MKVASSFIVLIAIALGFLILNKGKYSDSNLADKYFYKHGSYVTKGAEHAKKSRQQAVQYHDANKLFEAGKYRHARDIYNSMLFNDNPFREFAEWNLIMVKLKNDVPDDHQKILKRILKNNKHKMYSKAKLLDKDLNIFYRKLPF